LYADFGFLILLHATSLPVLDNLSLFYMGFKVKESDKTPVLQGTKRTFCEILYKSKKPSGMKSLIQLISNKNDSKSLLFSHYFMQFA